MKRSLTPKTLLVSLFIGLFFAGTFTFATALWHGTDWIGDGEVISAEMMRDNFDFLISLFGDSCTEYNENQVRVESGTLVVCDGANWTVLNITINDGSGCASDSDDILGGEHTVGQCNAAGGVAVSTDDGCLCQFGSSCAAGWTQHENWSSTVSNTCAHGKCKCSTGGHTFRNTGRESCKYGSLVGRISYCNMNNANTCYSVQSGTGCK